MTYSVMAGIPRGGGKMRTCSGELQIALESGSVKPCIRLTIDGTNYWSRCLQLEHVEEAYRDRATIILSNSDRALDDVDFTGQEFTIAYGCYTGEIVAEPNGDGAGNEYVETSNLWVKSQRLVSCMGELACQLDCEGQWTRLREQKIMAVGSAPYYQFTYNEESDDATIYDICSIIIEDVMGWDMNPLIAENDGIIGDFYPVIEVNAVPYESAAELLYRLIMMTKMYLRSRANHEFEFVYPQEDDEPVEVYGLDSAPFFEEYVEVNNILVPNSIVVLCNAPDPPDPPWPDLITGTAEDADSIAVYGEIIDIYLAGSIDNQTDADSRADAILTRIKAEQDGSRLILPFHDCRLELYDRISVVDSRGL